MKKFLSEMIAELWIKAEPRLLEWATSLLRRYLGLGRKLWQDLNTEITRLDANKSLSNDDRHKLAIAWLRGAMAIPDQEMPRFYLRPDWEGRAIQLVVLIRRLRAWLAPEPLI